MGSASQSDLFGHVPQKGEMPLETPRVSPQIVHTPDTIRARMLRLIGELRGADVMPWPPREVQSHRAMFPYMAEWLKDGEGERLLAEFRAEMARLEGA